MTLNIQSPKIKLKQEIIVFLNQKLNMLYRRYNEIISVDVCFRRQKSSTNENKICEMKLIIPGYDLIASSQCNTFQAAIAKTSEALERQIEKHKTKLENAKYPLIK